MEKHILSADKIYSNTDDKNARQQLSQCPLSNFIWRTVSLYLYDSLSLSAL